MRTVEIDPIWMESLVIYLPLFWTTCGLLYFSREYLIWHDKIGSNKPDTETFPQQIHSSGLNDDLLQRLFASDPSLKGTCYGRWYSMIHAM